MSVNRVQKLLFSEYCDFEDMVLIESPFAQTTKDGQGIRQVHLGLTPSKLVLATDILPPVEYVNVKYAPGIDPEIETFELIAIYPVECVNLSVYRKKHKQALKARFCNNKVLYFELGGFEKRAMFWNLWCEKVKFLSPEDTGSLRSETSVATSSTCSTLYLLDRKLVTINGIKQMWCKFGSSTLLGANETTDTNERSLVRKWTDKHLYLGKDFDFAINYQPAVSKPDDEFQKTVPKNKNKLVLRANYHPSYMEEKALNFGDSVQINRFGSGVNEGCGNPLYLTVDEYTIPRRLSQILHDSKSNSIVDENLNYYQLAEIAVLTWEFYKANDLRKYNFRHRRRYGLVTHPQYLCGFDPNITATGAKYSTIMKRAVSEINLKIDRDETEFTLPIKRKLLTNSISFQSLNSEMIERNNAIMNVEKSPLVLFWTPGYKYCPKSSKESYEKFYNQLVKIKEFQENVKNSKKRKRRKKLFRKSDAPKHTIKETDEESVEEPFSKKIKKKKHGFIYNIFNKNHVISELDTNKRANESSFHCFKRMLRADIILSSCDVDSTPLAENLTMIDKELFLKIPAVELEMLLLQQSSENAANICAIIVFSRRISCLIAHEVLKNDTEKTRARLIARFINVANKCHRIANFQSCKTILSGLQSPAIYRLRQTWAYVRKKHASKYESFEILCRLYKDPRLPAYQKTFFVLSQNSPFLPYIGDIICRLLGKVPTYDSQHFNKTVSRLPSVEETTKSSSSQLHFEEQKPQKIPEIFNKIYKIFIGGGDGGSQVLHRKIRSDEKKSTLHRKKVKFKTLFEYYSELDFGEEFRDKNLEKTKHFLEKCQLGAIDYNFCINSNVREYLLKSRYKDDKQNFYDSLVVEEPYKIYD